jgi:hypothetical protein
MKTNEHLQKCLIEFFSEREILQNEVTQKIKIRTLCSKTFFRKAYEMMWKNMVEPDSP